MVSFYETIEVPFDEIASFPKFGYTLNQGAVVAGYNNRTFCIMESIGDSIEWNLADVGRSYDFVHEKVQELYESFEQKKINQVWEAVVGAFFEEHVGLYEDLSVIEGRAGNTFSLGPDDRVYKIVEKYRSLEGRRITIFIDGNYEALLCTRGPINSMDESWLHKQRKAGIMVYQEVGCFVAPTRDMVYIIGGE